MGNPAMPHGNNSKQNQSHNETEHVEYTAVEPVAKHHRNVGFTDMTATWIGANANSGTWLVGGVVVGTAFAGAAFTGALTVTIVANIIAYIIVALVGFIGFKVGTATVALTRPSFGIRGSYLPSALNSLQFLGWAAVNTFIAATSMTYLAHGWLGVPSLSDPGGSLTMIVSILIICALQFGAVTYGHSSVKLFEKFGVILILILGIWETVVIFQQFSWHELVTWTAPQGHTMAFGSALDRMAAFSFLWAPAIAEFTRYAKSRTTSTIAPMVGANIGLFWFAFVGMIGAIGVAITTGVYDPDNSDPSTIISKLGLGPLALIVIILTVVTTNAIVLLSSGLSINNITRKIKPVNAVKLVAVLAFFISLSPLLSESFVDLFQTFLDGIGLVFGPIISILITDFYFVRRRRYETEMLDAQRGPYWYFKGFHVSALFAWLVGIVFYFIFHNFGIFTQALGGIYPSFVLSGLVYYIVVKLFAGTDKSALRPGESITHQDAGSSRDSVTLRG